MNSTKKSFLYQRLSSEQSQFIEKVHNRYFKSHSLKQDLFRFWDDYIPDDIKVDGKVFRSIKQYREFKDIVLGCGSFTEYRASRNDDRIKLVNANFCKKDKICLSCAVGRAYNQQKRFMQILNVYPYERDDDLLSKHWYYIVTPVRHSIDEDLMVVYDRADKLRKSALMQIRDGRRGKSKGFWSRFNGGIGSVEVTYTKNGWNVHINWLVNSNDESDMYLVSDKKKEWYQNKYLEAFLERFNDSYIHSISKLSFRNRDEIRANLVEVLKYSLKFSSLDAPRLILIYYFFYRKRLFFSFGNLRGLDLECIDDVAFGDDISDYEDFVKLMYRRLSDDSYELFSVSG